MGVETPLEALLGTFAWLPQMLFEHLRQIEQCIALAVGCSAAVEGLPEHLRITYPSW